MGFPVAGFTLRRMRLGHTGKKHKGAVVWGVVYLCGGCFAPLEAPISVMLVQELYQVTPPFLSSNS